MKKVLTIILVSVFISSCTSKSWSEADKKEFLNNCITMSNNAENAETTCRCGLQKTMEKYKTKNEARKALEKMTHEESEAFYADCF